ncbi:carboxypeptidase-like regulatory domain-containing protein [Capnocytophaga sp. oral taxon 878]|uniref:carboxypeptidase-like regulatory domain-containing protein n=1 Tax=Capnocytophaga sp. oral taxon 878 TaxID=1316596 RepID=UPI0020C537CC|nr:carboxypeptidase-like regulatory domain-containing protein [Capnocytophaga sp. oral taxon 878]
MKRIFLLLTLLGVNISYIFAQQTEVRGRVTDENKQPLVGVTVLLEGTNNALLPTRQDFTISTTYP